jgi:hypothetical protein
MTRMVPLALAFLVGLGEADVSAQPRTTLDVSALQRLASAGSGSVVLRLREPDSGAPADFTVRYLERIEPPRTGLNPVHVYRLSIDNAADVGSAVFDGTNVALTIEGQNRHYELRRGGVDREQFASTRDSDVSLAFCRVNAESDASAFRAAPFSIGAPGVPDNALVEFTIAVAVSGKLAEKMSAFAQPNGMQVLFTELAHFVGELSRTFSTEVGVSLRLRTFSEMLPTDAAQHNYQTLSDVQSMFDRHLTDYDIGHLLTWDQNNRWGQAEPASMCSLVRGRGVTAVRMLDAASLPVVMHEVGHQLGARHTHNMKHRTADSAFEAGRGNSAMAVAMTRHFHARSVEDIAQAIARRRDENALCGEPMPAPELIAQVSATDVVVPVNTPFMLRAASHPEIVRYRWDEFNRALHAEDDTRPPFYHSHPGRSAERYFPSLASLFAGGMTPGDAKVPRPGELIFRVLGWSPHSLMTHHNIRVTVVDTKPFEIRRVVPQADRALRIDYAGEHLSAAPFNVSMVQPLILVDNTRWLEFPPVPNSGSFVLDASSLPARTRLRVMLRAVDAAFLSLSNEMALR